MTNSETDSDSQLETNGAIYWGLVGIAFTLGATASCIGVIAEWGGCYLVPGAGFLALAGFLVAKRFLIHAQ